MDSTDLASTTDDLISFFDSELWLNFKQIVPESGRNIKNNLIDIIYRQITEGKLAFESILQKYNYNDLVDSFISSPNINFLHLCLSLYQKINFTEPFLENIFINAPQIIIGCLENALFTGNYDLMKNIAHISVFLLNYNNSSSNQIREILEKIQIEITLIEIFSFASSFNKESQEESIVREFNMPEFSTLLQNIYYKNKNAFWNIIQNIVDKENSLSIKLLNKSFNKMKEFQIFMNLIPQSNTNMKSNVNYKMISSIPDLISFFEQTNQIHQSLIDLYNSNDKTTFNYLIKSIEYSKECSQEIKTEFLNRLRSMKIIPLNFEIEKLNMNLNLNDKIVRIDQIIEYIERTKFGCEQFASKLFNIFHLSYMKQNEQTMKSFVDQFYQKYLRRLQFQTLDKLAEIAVDFLQSDLIQQHRISLSAFAIRLPLSKHIQKFFFNEFEVTSNSSKSGIEIMSIIQKNIRKELAIIENLHTAAIQTCNYFKLNSQGGNYSSSQKSKKSRSSSCSLNIISSDVSNSNSNESSLNDDCRLSLSADNSNRTVVGLDRKLILRLRWRTLRDDTSCNLSFLPEFTKLCESDEKMFLRWESGCSYPTGIKRNQILMKLGILNNHEIIPSLLFELLRIDTKVDDNFVDLLNPVFSNNVDLKLVKIPENPNFAVLFRFDFLWCTAVMCHPRICEALRNPTEEISVALLRSLFASPIIRDYLSNNGELIIADFTQNDEKNNKYFDQLFTTFPLAFSAILSNLPSFENGKSQSKSVKINQDLTFISNFKRPIQIIQAEQILNGSKRPSKNLPRYLVVSVTFEFAKRNKLMHLADMSNGDQTWIFFCFFFSVSFQKFDISVELLKKFDFLFEYLCKGVNEENLFVGARKWTNGLIQFSIYCSNNGITFDDHQEWLIFNEMTQQVLQEQNTDIFPDEKVISI